jgi:hypothetical protein
MAATTQGRLPDRVAVITGPRLESDRQATVGFAEEGAHVAIADWPAPSAGTEATALDLPVEWNRPDRIARLQTESLFNRRFQP